MDPLHHSLAPVGIQGLVTPSRRLLSAVPTKTLGTNGAATKSARLVFIQISNRAKIITAPRSNQARNYPSQGLFGQALSELFPNVINSAGPTAAPGCSSELRAESLL